MADKSAVRTGVGAPSSRDAALAERAARKPAELADGTGPVPVRFGAVGVEPVDLPAPAVRCSGRAWARWRTATVSR